jgi:hypothetical protein
MFFLIIFKILVKYINIIEFDTGLTFEIFVYVINTINSTIITKLYGISIVLKLSGLV